MPECTLGCLVAIIAATEVITTMNPQIVNYILYGIVVLIVSREVV